QVNSTTVKFRMNDSSIRSPTTSETGRSCSKDQPQSPCSSPEKPRSVGQIPTHTAYCSMKGLSRPNWARMNSARSSAALSPWLRNSAIWLERKSPGGSLMMLKVTRLITSSVGIMISSRRIVYVSMRELLAEPEGIGPVDAEKRARIPVVDALLGNVPEGVAHHHRLRHACDHADHELLLGMDLQHAVPDLRALVARRGIAPLAVPLHQLGRLVDVRRLARLAAGLEILAELGPLQLILG